MGLLANLAVVTERSMSEGRYVSNKLLYAHFGEVRQQVCSVRDKLLFILSQLATHAHLFCWVFGADMSVLLISTHSHNKRRSFDWNQKHQQIATPPTGSDETYITRFIPSYTFQGTGLIQNFRFNIKSTPPIGEPAIPWTLALRKIVLKLVAKVILTISKILN